MNKKLNVDGYYIEISKSVKNGITGTYVDVKLEHEHHHEHRNLDNVKFRQIDIDTELVTPTGAAIIAELADEFTTLPAMVTEKIGW